MEPCCVVDEEDEKVQRQVESHELGCCDCFEYSVNQWIHLCHVTTGHRCACGWYSHGADGSMKAVLQP